MVEKEAKFENGYIGEAGRAVADLSVLFTIVI